MKWSWWASDSVSELEGPHFFRYTEDPANEVSDLLGKGPPLRPIVPVRLCYLGETSFRVVALVDSGSERVFAASSLARELNLDLHGALETVIGLGGEPRRVRFKTVRIELFADMLINDDPPLVGWDAEVAFLKEWQPPWGVLLGRDGFFDRFTVTMHGGVPGLVVEPWRAFDDRFGIEIAEANNKQPRFKW